MGEETFLQFDVLPDPALWAQEGDSFRDAQGNLYKEIRFLHAVGDRWVTMMFQSVECATDMAQMRGHLESDDGKPMLERVDFRNPVETSTVRTSRGPIESLVSDIAGVSPRGRETIVYSVIASRGDETFRIVLAGESALLETVAGECSAVMDAAIFIAR